MVISNIKLGFARKKMAALPRKTGLFDGEGPLKSICVVLDKEDAGLVEGFNDLRETLEIKEEDFRMVLCLTSKPKMAHFEGLLFTTADLNWRGKIKNLEVQELLKREFDLLVSFTRKESKTAKLICTGLKADLKVNRREESSSDFDLTISTEFEEVHVFLTELKKYLKILNKVRE